VKYPPVYQKRQQNKKNEKHPVSAMVSIPLGWQHFVLLLSFQSKRASSVAEQPLKVSV
jgi:hypothetical protein